MTERQFAIVYCIICGNPVPQLCNSRQPKRVCRSGSFRPNGVERPSQCALSQRDHGKLLAAKERYRRRHHDKINAYIHTSAYRERRNERDQLSRRLNPEMWRERWHRQQARKRRQVERAKLAAGQDLLSKIRAVVPAHYDRATRDEMVGEAVMLALEGATVPDAVKAAIKAINKAEAPGRYAKPIEDCFWL